MEKLLGQAIATLRQAAGYSQRRLSRLSGVSQQHISRIELGEALPTVRVLLDLAQALRTTPDGVLKIAGLLEGEPEQIGAIDVYQIAKQLGPKEQEKVREFANWRLCEQRSHEGQDIDS